MEDILHSYLLATHYDPSWYKAWHTWALANFEVISHMENENENRTVDIPGKGLAAHVVQAVEGSLQSDLEDIHLRYSRLFPFNFTS